MQRLARRSTRQQTPHTSLVDYAVVAVHGELHAAAEGEAVDGSHHGHRQFLEAVPAKARNVSDSTGTESSLKPYMPALARPSLTTSDLEPPPEDSNSEMSAPAQKAFGPVPRTTTPLIFGSFSIARMASVNLRGGWERGQFSEEGMYNIPVAHGAGKAVDRVVIQADDGDTIRSDRLDVGGVGSWLRHLGGGRW